MSLKHALLICWCLRIVPHNTSGFPLVMKRRTSQQQRRRPSCRQHMVDQPSRVTAIYPRSSSSSSLAKKADTSLSLQTQGQTSNKGTIPKLSISLIKSIVGSGILALPAGFSALGNNPDAVIPVGCSVIVFMGAVNAFFFWLVGRICAETGATTYQQAWERTVGTEGSTLVATVVTFKTALACVAYCMILADSLPSVALLFLGSNTNGGDGASSWIPLVATTIVSWSRSQVLAVVSVTGLLPLCLLPDLSALAPFSFLGVLGIGFTGLCMAIRFGDGSYAVPDGAFLPTVPPDLQPAFGTTGPEPQGLILACTLATAFVAHYNAPRFYAELENNTVERFEKVVGISYGTAALCFICVASLGFATFGQDCAGFILRNYSPYDPLVAVSKAALAAAILLSFPLPFFGFRDGVMDLLSGTATRATPDENVDRESTTVVADCNVTNRFVLNRNDPATRTAVTIVLLAGVAATASQVHDLALLQSVGGGTFSTAVASVFPTFMFRAMVTANKEKQEGQPKENTLVVGFNTQGERDGTIALGLMVVCVLIGGTGVSLALEKAFQANAF